MRIIKGSKYLFKLLVVRVINCREPPSFDIENKTRKCEEAFRSSRSRKASSHFLVARSLRAGSWIFENMNIEMLDNYRGDDAGRDHGSIGAHSGLSGSWNDVVRVQRAPNAFRSRSDVSPHLNCSYQCANRDTIGAGPSVDHRSPLRPRVGLRAAVSVSADARTPSIALKHRPYRNHAILRR